MNRSSDTTEDDIIHALIIEDLATWRLSRKKVGVVRQNAKEVGRLNDVRPPVGTDEISRMEF